VDRRTPIADIIVTRGNTDTHFSLEDVADAIGDSLTDLLISRREDEKSIFTEVNRQFVSDVAHSVANSLTKSLDEGGRLRLSEATSTCSSKRPCSKTKPTTSPSPSPSAARWRKPAPSTSTPARTPCPSA
jgi:hypothetical protein